MLYLVFLVLLFLLPFPLAFELEIRAFPCGLFTTVFGIFIPLCLGVVSLESLKI